MRPGQWLAFTAVFFLLSCNRSNHQSGEKALSLKSLESNQPAFGSNDFSYAGEALNKDDFAYLPGSYDHIQIGWSPTGDFELEVTARGDVVRDLKPVMSIYLGRISPADSLGEVIVDSSWQTYRLTLRGDGRALLLAFVNDYWDPDAGEDVNLYIKQVIYKSISPISNGIITFSGNSFLVSWNANTDPDLAGYRVHLGHQSHAYSAKYDTKDTTYRFSGLQSDTLYYVAVSAVDTAGNESGFSEEKVIRLVDKSLPQPSSSLLQPPRSLVINHSAFGPDDFSYAGEARHKDEAAYIPGSYDHIFIARSPHGAFDLEVMARGDVVRNLKPVMRIYLGKITPADSLAEVIVDSTWQTYHLALRGDGRALLLVFVNDYWDPDAGEDVNLYIKHVIYNVAGTGVINIAGNSFFASWNANDEPNLAGYRVHLGYQSRVYSFTQATASTYYRFLNLQSDTLYYVAVTAVDAAGKESGFSEEKMVRLVSATR